MSAILQTPLPATNRILIASADHQFRDRAVSRLRNSCWHVDIANGGADALGKMEISPARLLLLDGKLPDLQPADVIDMVEARFPGVDVVLVNSTTGALEIPSELLGTFADQVLQMLQSVENVALAPVAPTPVAKTELLPGVVGCSEAMKRLVRMVTLVACRDTTVLITGETGTGKELIASAIHKLSGRNAKPFVTVNCAAIPEALLEAELFGHTKGAFTGAVQSRIGKIHAAQGGTLFLDEIGEMLPAMQAKLLRFLENSEVQRLGSSDVFRVDVRVVAATNCRLLQKVQRGEFREDLYYRLAVFPVEMPPLRDRGRDLNVLAEHFARNFGGDQVRLSTDAEGLLQAHCWPGNVRELKHVIERATILAEGENVLRSEHICIGGMSTIS